MKEEYYTYAWLRDDGTPFYIGKGIGNRAYCPHRRGDRYMSAPPKEKIIFLKKNLTEFAAYKHENYIISILEIKENGGMLINMSYGGEGSSGRKSSEETKRKQSEAHKGKTHSKEHKDKVSYQVSQRKWWNNGEIDKHTIECPGDGWVLGRLFNTSCKSYKTNEFSEKSRKNNLGKNVSDETRSKQSKVRKGRKWWNNGEKTKLCYECPGDGWILGRPGHLIN